LAGSEVKFDKQGDGLARYDILNYQKLQNSTGYHYRVRVFNLLSATSKLNSRSPDCRQVVQQFGARPGVVDVEPRYNRTTHLSLFAALREWHDQETAGNYFLLSLSAQAAEHSRMKIPFGET
jgi:hypothetical protein